ncbi:hypothetical protein [Mastigocoleus sp. MO_188.B34]|nr:hypothetical protein [Mastigocoleus sp. MO_188.B34]MDJ0697800.1 hypothetical protein [Mastigocoleus sp. MO_188.B34]
MSSPPEVSIYVYFYKNKYTSSGRLWDEIEVQDKSCTGSDLKCDRSRSN